MNLYKKYGGWICQTCDTINYGYFKPCETCGETFDHKHPYFYKLRPVITEKTFYRLKEGDWLSDFKGRKMRVVGFKNGRVIISGIYGNEVIYRYSEIYYKYKKC